MKQPPAFRAYLLRFLLTSGIGYIRNSTANVIKAMTRREPYFNKGEIIFRHYLYYKLGLRPVPKITARTHQAGLEIAGIVELEGVGSQVLKIMYAIVFARSCGIIYVHTPFIKIGHADRPMETWVDAWENQFNLGRGEIQAEQVQDQVIDISRGMGFIEASIGARRIESAFRIVIHEFRRKYYSNKHARNNAVVIIGVHVRRGDVSKEQNQYMWTDNSMIRHTIDQVLTILDNNNMKYRINLFSEGSVSDFGEFEAIGANLFINADAVWTLQELIESDILVMAKSRLSFVAGVISDGIKLYEPFGFGEITSEDWIVRSPTGDFDERGLAIQLEEKIRVRPEIG
jgi:hypothetical protein